MQFYAISFQLISFFTKQFEIGIGDDLVTESIERQLEIDPLIVLVILARIWTCEYYIMFYFY